MVSIKKCDKCDETQNIQTLSLYTHEFNNTVDGWDDWTEEIDLCPKHLLEYTNKLHTALKQEGRERLGQINTKFIGQNKTWIGPRN